MALPEQSDSLITTFDQWLNSLRNKKINGEKSFTLFARDDRKTLSDVVFMAKINLGDDSTYSSEGIVNAPIFKDLVGVDFIYRSLSIPDVSDLGYRLVPVAWSDKTVDEINDYLNLKMQLS